MAPSPLSEPKRSVGSGGAPPPVSAGPGDRSWGAQSHGHTSGPPPGPRGAGTRLALLGLSTVPSVVPYLRRRSLTGFAKKQASRITALVLCRLGSSANWLSRRLRVAGRRQGAGRTRTARWRSRQAGPAPPSQRPPPLVFPFSSSSGRMRRTFRGVSFHTASTASTERVAPPSLPLSPSSSATPPFPHLLAKPAHGSPASNKTGRLPSLSQPKFTLWRVQLVAALKSFLHWPPGRRRDGGSLRSMGGRKRRPKPCSLRVTVLPGSSDDNHNSSRKASRSLVQASRSPSFEQRIVK